MKMEDYTVISTCRFVVACSNPHFLCNCIRQKLDATSTTLREDPRTKMTGGGSNDFRVSRNGQHQRLQTSDIGIDPLQLAHSKLAPVHFPVVLVFLSQTVLSEALRPRVAFHCTFFPGPFTLYLSRLLMK